MVNELFPEVHCCDIDLVTIWFQDGLIAYTAPFDEHLKYCFLNVTWFPTVAVYLGQHFCLICWLAISFFWGYVVSRVFHSRPAELI
jgi:hypothetical protein